MSEQQLTEKEIIDEGFWGFINATNTATAGGGLDGYKHMLDKVAWTMSCDHGPAAVARIFGAIAEHYKN